MQTTLLLLETAVVVILYVIGVLAAIALSIYLYIDSGKQIEARDKELQELEKYADHTARRWDQVIRDLQQPIYGTGALHAARIRDSLKLQEEIDGQQK